MTTLSTLLLPSVYAVGMGLQTAPSSLANQISALNPGAWWRFDETSGTALLDETANGVDATWLNSPTLGVTGLVSGDSSTAVTLNGTDQYATIDTAADLDILTQDFAIELLVKTTQTTGNKAYLDRRVNGGTADGYLVGMTDGVPTMFITKSGVIYQRTATSSVADGNPHHIVFNFKRGAGEIWVDGVEESTGDALTSSTITNVTTVARIGTRTVGTSSYTAFGGTMDELVFYDGAVLSAEQVAAHFAATGF